MGYALLVRDRQFGKTHVGITRSENIAALLRCIPGFISVLAEFDLNSLVILVFPQILLEMCT